MMACGSHTRRQATGRITWSLCTAGQARRTVETALSGRSTFRSIAYDFRGLGDPDKTTAGFTDERLAKRRAGRSGCRRRADIHLALDILNGELGIKRLLLEGGGSANGPFLRAGLIDEINLAIFRAVNGTKVAPCVFDSSGEEAGMPARSSR
jgi:riboflavin biosynthesis pyrimidine reductase